MKEGVKLRIFTIISLIIILFGIVVITVDKSTTPVGYFLKITSDTIRDITSDLIKDITSRFLKITGKPTLTASFEFVGGAGPYLSQNIPNQTWNEDTNISLNLSLYFTDPDNDDLSFTYNNSISNFSSITLTIDNSTNIANLTPNKNWYGIGYIVFITTDGNLQNQSNNVTLNVTSVNDAPILNGTIPNFNWDEDTNLNNAFDLDDYFYDVEGDSLTFSATGNSSTIINIDAINHQINFSSASNWYGTEYVVFTASDGTNTTNSNNITLTVNSMPEAANLTQSGYSGSTTDLSSMNSTQLQNVSNFTLENTQYAFLGFTIPVNLSIPINFSDPSHINVSNNLIFVNTTLFPELNKSAEIKFYSLTFSNPQILMDGEVCPVHICTELDYSSGIFFFNVSHFTTYTTRETPTEAPSPAAAAPSAAGGGGGGAAGAATFRLSKDLIKVVIAPGIKKTVEFNVKNLGTVPRDYTIEVEGIKEFVKIDESSFSLEPAQSKDVKIYIEVPEDKELGVYTGSIIVKSALISQMIKVINELQSAELLFDVDVDVLKTHKKIYSGEEVLTQVIVYDLKQIGKVDVNVYYTIKDMKGNEIIADKETVSIDGQASFIKSIKLPEIEPGSYVFAIKVIYKGSVGTATDVFEVMPITELPAPIIVKEKVFAPINMLIWLGALLIITFIILIILYFIIKIYIAK